MPGTNEILPFASTNTGTNLLTQAEYTADAQRTTGNQPGIARSKLVNKALRQSSLIAAGVAEFIADYQSNNVTDSLTAQQVADYLVAAIYAAVPMADSVTAGRVELADGAEVAAGTDSNRAITPAGLLYRTATEARTGLIEIASSAEAAALADTVRALPPGYLKAAFGTSGAANLYAARSWISFDGNTMGVQSSANVGSIQRLGTGLYRMNFINAMPHANYAFMFASDDYNEQGCCLARTTTYMDFGMAVVEYNQYRDCSNTAVAIFC